MAAPASVTADGSVKVIWFATAADPEAPTLAELTAGIDLTEYLTADGLTTTSDEQSITDDRLSSRQTFERPGRYRDEVNLMYVYRQQDVGDADNEAYDTLKHKTEGYLAVRWGKDFEDAIATADVIDIIAVQCGKQIKQTPEANSVLKVAQKMFTRSNTVEDYAVPAA